MVKEEEKFVFFLSYFSATCFFFAPLANHFFWGFAFEQANSGGWACQGRLHLKLKHPRGGNPQDFGTILRDYHRYYCYTVPETSIAPENGWLEDCFLLGDPIFRCYVSFREAYVSYDYDYHWYSDDYHHPYHFILIINAIMIVDIILMNIINILTNPSSDHHWFLQKLRPPWPLQEDISWMQKGALNQFPCRWLPFALKSRW